MTWVENLHNASIVYNNPNSSPCLQIHLLVIDTDADDEERPDNDGYSDHESEDFSDHNLDEVFIISTTKMRTMMKMYTSL